MDASPCEKSDAPFIFLAYPIMRHLFRSIGLFFVRLFGTRVTDYQTGRDLGKVLVIGWCGKVHVIGLENAKGSFSPAEAPDVLETGNRFHDTPSARLPKRTDNTFRQSRGLN